MTKLFLPLSILLIAALALVGLSSWCLVAPGEVVVVRRLGRLIEPPWGPGLHGCFPFGIDHIDRIRSDVVRQLTIGGVEAARADRESGSGEMMTADLNLVRVSASVQYRVARPVDFALRAAEVEPLVARTAEAAIARALAVHRVDGVLRDERQAIARESERALQEAADGYSLGIAVLGVSLTDARPPGEVEADFAAAQSAESERERRINEARSYEETTTTQARAQAQARLETARSGAERKGVLARARADRFIALQAEAKRAPALTVRRLYVETLQTLLAGVKTKLILPPGEAVDLTVLGIKEEANRRAGE
jgi:membrane protease subunit HflK